MKTVCLRSQSQKLSSLYSAISAMLESNGRAFVLILVLAKAFIRNFLMLCYTVHITNDVCYLYFNYYFMKMISESILDGYNRSIVGCFVVENRTGFHDAIAGYQWILGIFHKWRPGCRSIYRGWRFRLYLESGRSRPRPPGWKNSSRRQISSGRLFLPIFVCFGCKPPYSCVLGCTVVYFLIGERKNL